MTIAIGPKTETLIAGQLKSLSFRAEMKLFRLWQEGRAEIKDAKWLSALWKVLLIGEPDVVEVILDAKPKHRTKKGQK